jgi:hypothetical protein
MPQAISYKIINPEMVYYDRENNRIEYFGKTLYFKTNPINIISFNESENTIIFEISSELSHIIQNVETFITDTIPASDIQPILISAVDANDTNYLKLNLDMSNLTIIRRNKEVNITELSRPENSTVSVCIKLEVNGNYIQWTLSYCHIIC